MRLFDKLTSVLPADLADRVTPRRAAIAGGGLAFALIAAIGGYKVYEDHTTEGVGFVDAGQFMIPDDTPIEEKKRGFFDALRPIVEAENARIARQRAIVLEAREIGDSDGEVADIAAEYGLEDWDAAAGAGADWSGLLARVDTVPLTLTLAQAANESSWGQSRFAQEGSNLFGQWCFTEGCGIVPGQREAGKSHEVAAFGSVNASVRAYLHNINTGGAYTALRKLRQQARAAGEDPRATVLASGLARYSERGLAYVHEIKGMIRTNRELMRGE